MGKSYPLHCVNIHQDRKGYGNAVPDEIRAEDFEFIKEIGANELRLAHYPHHSLHTIRQTKWD